MKTALKYRKLKSRYGLSRTRYEAILRAQDNRCAICFAELDEGKQTHVDHDHHTKEIRGILCRDCNLGIGHFEDSIELFERAIRYLRPFALREAAARIKSPQEK